MARRPSKKGMSLGQYLVSLGASVFCVECYGYFYHGHACPDWTLARPAFRPTTARLEGGLTHEEVA